MRIGFVCYGSLGDVFPYKALAKLCSKLGHQVRICSHDIFAKQFDIPNLEFITVGSPFDKASYDEMFDKTLEIKNPFKAMLFQLHNMDLIDAKPWYNDCVKALKGCDVAVLNAYDYGGQEAAKHNSIPWATVTPCPGYIKTSFEPPQDFPNLGKTINSLFWKFLSWKCKAIYDPPVNEFLTSIGGRPRQDIAFETCYSPFLNLISASPSLCNVYMDRPNHYKFTGAWFDEDESYIPSQELLDFLKKGPAPVVVSFSSVGGTHGSRIAKIILEAIETLKLRVIIQKGWLDLYKDTVNPNIYFAPFIPHSYLFKHCSLVIHHGGAGITHRACKAGLQSVVIPFFGDEYYWGDLLHKRQIAPKMIRHNHLNESNLTKAIKEALINPIYKQKALEMSVMIHKEDGLTAALKRLREHEFLPHVRQP